MATATHAQFEAKWDKLVTLAGQLPLSAQIPFPALIAIGHEVQTTLDQCERLASKSSQLEGEREVVADLVIGHDLAIVQNQPKLTADWFTHRMSATQTPAAAVSKKRAHAHISSSRLEETGPSGAQGPARSGREGFISIHFCMATDCPHLSMVQSHPPI